MFIGNIIRKFDFEQIWKQSLSWGDKYSSKRVTKFFVIFCMMFLTFWDFYAHERTLKMEVLGTWLALIGYDGYRVTQEKKIEANAKKNETNNISAG